MMVSESVVPPAGKRSRRVGRHTILFLIVGYFAAALDGGNQESWSPNPLFHILLSLIGALNLGLWAVEDARQHGHPVPISSRKWFVIFGWILVPVYAIRSRRWKGLGWVIFHGVGLTITMYAAYWMTAVATYG